jgi:hypothetical protein
MSYVGNSRITTALASFASIHSQLQGTKNMTYKPTNELLRMIVCGINQFFDDDCKPRNYAEKCKMIAKRSSVSAVTVKKVLKFCKTQQYT